jgi:starch phosphorylase
VKAQNQKNSRVAGLTESQLAKLIQQYGCGPVRFTGTDEALYERHLIFDNVMEMSAIGARERFEAIAHSVRDLLSQRWIRTEKTYEHENPKRVYYLSMEFLIGRSLANNVTNLLLDPVAKAAIKDKNLDWFELLEQEPDAGLGNGGLGRLAACFLDSMATMQIPATGYGLRYEYGMFKQTIQDGWQHELPDNWLRRPDPWEVARRCFASSRRSSITADRCAVRSPRSRPRRQDDQYAAALGRGGTGLLRLPGIQQG